MENVEHIEGKKEWINGDCKIFTNYSCTMSIEYVYTYMLTTFMFLSKKTINFALNR